MDEAGRGPLAGPVVAAACILPEDHGIVGLDDSKKLTAARREALFAQITQNPAILYGIGIVDAEVIDQINILQATIRAMQDAVDGLLVLPDFLLVDGLQLPHPRIPSEKVIKGDAKSESIAAASILAKVTRDKMMLEADQLFAGYGFAKHKGYGTKQHREAIAKLGPCSIHRTSFEPIKSMV